MDMGNLAVQCNSAGWRRKPERLNRLKRLVFRCSNFKSGALGAASFGAEISAAREIAATSPGRMSGRFSREMGARRFVEAMIVNGYVLPCCTLVGKKN
jgi:hypothetical protein